MKLVLYSTDPKSQKPSVSLTFLWYGLIIASVKLLLSGMVIGGYTFSEFGGSDFALIVGAVAGLYGWRKRESHKSDMDLMNNGREGE